MTKEIYNQLAAKLANVTDNEGNAVFRHIDLWNKQVQFLTQESPFDMPACFIAFAPINWQQLGQGSQQAEIDIALHIVTRWKTPTFYSGAYQAQGTAYLDIPDYVWAHLHRSRHETYGTLMRISSEVNHDHEEIVDSIENYRGIVQIKPQQTGTAVTASPGITMNR